MMRSKHIARQLLDVEAIARHAEAIPGVMVYASYLPEAYLIRLTNEEALVVTGRNGYLRLRAKDIRPLIEELENILGLSQTAYADDFYDITKSVSPDGSGSVSVKVNGNEATKAKKDDAITLKATPAQNYQFEDLTVTKPKELTTVADLVDVMGNVVFSDRSDTYDCYVESSNFVLINKTGDRAELESGTSITKNDNVYKASTGESEWSFTINESTGKIESITFSTQIDDITLMGISANSVPTEEVDTEPGTEAGTYTFTMPESDVTVNATFEQVTKYPLWVGGTQVTSANMSGDGWSYTRAEGTTPATLTLNNYTYNSGAFQDSAICANENLTIELVGNNNVYSTLVEANCHAIYVSGQLTIQGSGRLDTKGKRYGIYANKGLTIEGCNVIARSTETTEGEYIYRGISSANEGDITIKNATVKVSAVVGNAIDSGGDVIIEDSTVEAHSTNHIGVSSYEGNVEINAGSKVSASGNEQAISGTVKNSIAGTGWTDKAGSQGEATIPINADPGQKLPDYKKVQFPEKVDKVTVKFDSAGGSTVPSQTIAVNGKATKPADPTKDGYTFDGWYLGDTAFDFGSSIEANITLTAHWKQGAQSTITYDLNGGTLNGETGKVAVKVNNGTVITLPAPTRDGYTFDYWEGSKYNAGDKYTVNGDHTFKAVWKTGAGGDGKKGSGTKTGDENTLGAWIVLLVAALAGTTGMVAARKRRND